MGNGHPRQHHRGFIGWAAGYCEELRQRAKGASTQPLRGRTAGIKAAGPIGQAASQLGLGRTSSIARDALEDKTEGFK